MSKPVLRAVEAAAMLAVGLLVGGTAVAQTAQPPLPPGISIGPRPPAEPGGNQPNGTGEQGAQGAQQPPHQQDGPGCTYRDNKLELIV